MERFLIELFASMNMRNQSRPILKIIACAVVLTVVSVIYLVFAFGAPFKNTAILAVFLLPFACVAVNSGFAHHDKRKLLERSEQAALNAQMLIGKLILVLLKFVAFGLVIIFFLHFLMRA